MKQITINGIDLEARPDGDWVLQYIWKRIKEYLEAPFWAFRKSGI